VLVILTGDRETKWTSSSDSPEVATGLTGCSKCFLSNRYRVPILHSSTALDVGTPEGHCIVSEPDVKRYRPCLFLEVSVWDCIGVIATKLQ
jgi:hypothetical protein